VKDLDNLRWAVETLRWVKQRKAELKDAEDKARDAIEQALGDDASGTLDGHAVINWKSHKRTALDQKYLKQQFREVYESCLVTREVRRMEVLDDDN